MPFISREDFEKMIQTKVKETGLSEEIVRRDTETTARLNGFQIEEPDTVSFVERFAKYCFYG